MLEKKHLKYLRSLAQQKKTIVWIGQNGLTGKVMEEIESALQHHELVKISVRVGEREKRDEVIQQFCLQSGAELVQKIGNTASIYRANITDPVIRLP